ncbi:MAG: DUF5057 domain-containing protein [Clostridia bacterium]|nr:DUF5057 domain-containing protein [Clostridia bacterium]
MLLKSERLKKKISLFLAFVFLAFVCFGVPTSYTLSSSVFPQLGPLRILEVEPGTTFDITSNMKSSLETYFGRTIELTQMPMPLFISKVEQVNGYYDIVYIGNNQTGADGNQNIYGGDKYSQFGPSKKLNGTDLPNVNLARTVANNKEFYSGNDITNKTAANLKSFINSNQLVVFDSGIFTSAMQKTKLYTNFNAYQGRANVKVGTTSTLLNNLKAYSNSAILKRPALQLTSSPVQYDGTNIDANGELLSFAMNLKNMNSDDLMTVNLFIDKNGDGIYKDSEMVRQYNNVGETNGYTINYLIPSGFTGVVPWKLEITDKFGVKSYKTGFTAYKGTELRIRVLQLLSDRTTSTLNLSSLSNYNNNGQRLNLLYKPGEYKVEVTEMNIREFNNNYGSLVNGKPTTLNGNYDMVIFGFDDSYIGDLSGRALSDVVAFADSKQSIMFTHDTIGYQSTNHNLTNAFRNRLGLNAFATDPSLPTGITASTGITRIVLYVSSSYRDPYGFPNTILTRKINQSNLTMYPYVLGDITVSPTHVQYLRLDMEDPDVATAFTYKNEKKYSNGFRTANLITPVQQETIYHDYDAANDYYTFFKGNLTFSGTGHSNITSLDELKMFVNTIIKASTGSNHAPTVEIKDLSDNQDIANTLQNLNFSIVASDYEDAKLKGQIYIDLNGNGNYEEAPAATFDGDDSLLSGVEKAVSLAKSVPNSVTRFGIKVVATDSQNAQGVCVININNKNTPTLTLNTNASNCLLGDTANIDLNVSAQPTTLNTRYRNISLRMTLDTDAFSSINASGWTSTGNGNYSKSLQDVIFAPQPNITTQSSSINFVCSRVGTHTVNANVSYTDGYGNAVTSNGNFTLGVRSGEVNAEIKDAFGQSVGSLPVILNSTTPNSGFVPLTIATDSTGVAKFNNIPTGYYGATVQLPAGYTALGIGSGNRSLSVMADGILHYDNSTRVISFPELYPLVSLSIQGSNSVGVWESIRYTSTVNADTYKNHPELVGPVVWSVIPGSGNGTINSSTGGFTATRPGDVTIVATRKLKDKYGHELPDGFRGEKRVTISNIIDIN